MNGKLLLVLTEVDDLVYTGDQELVDIFEAKLRKKWNIQQSEPLRSFLGININYDREQGTIEFDVAEKIRRLFEEKPWRINQPKLESLIPPITARSYPLIETKHYASVVGACIYMAITCRPDIAHAVGRVSRAMLNPSREDARRVITLLQYLNRTRSHKLVYHRDEHRMRRQLHKYAEKDREFHNYLKSQCENTIKGNQLIGFTDADYARKLDPDLKSTSGFCFMFRHNVTC